MDGFERRHADGVIVVRLDVRSDVGNYLAYHFAVRAVPTFLMFNAAGQPLGRHVGIASGKMLDALLNESLKER